MAFEIPDENQTSYNQQAAIVRHLAEEFNVDIRYEGKWKKSWAIVTLPDGRERRFNVFGLDPETIQTIKKR